MGAGTGRGQLKNKSSLAVVAAWLAIMFLVLMQYRALEQTSRSLNELENSVDNLWNTLYFKAPYRTTRASDLTLNIQLIDSLRLQLQADSEAGWFQPDLTQVLYVTDRFVEQTQTFLNVELSIVDLVTSLQTLRDRYALLPDQQAEYLKIGAYVLQALYGEDERNPKLYRTFDALLKSSQSLPPGARDDMQQTLAKVSVLLSNYAEGDNLVDKLLQHRVHNEIMLSSTQYRQHFKVLTLLTMGTSAIAILGLIGLGRWQDATPVRGPENSQAESTTQEPPAQQETANLPSRLVTEPPVMHKAIDLERMLESLNGDQESVAMLLEVFVEDHRNDDQSLRQLLATDREASLRKAHSLKGVAGNLGADGLQQIALTIELALKQGGLPSEAELQQLTLQLKRTTDSARQYLKQRGG